MRLGLSWLSLGIILVLGLTAATAQADAPKGGPEGDALLDLPGWARTAYGILTLVGVGLLIGALSVVLARGDLVKQVRPNFTPWSPVEVLILGFVWYLLRTLPLGLIVVVGGTPAQDIPMAVRFATDLSAALVVMLMGLWGIHRRFGVAADSLGFRKERWWVALGLALATLLAMLPLRVLVGVLLDEFGVRDVRQPVVERMLTDISGVDLAIACASAVLLAPVIEEFLFRGLLQMSLRRYVGPWGAVFLGGVLFAAIHQPWPIAVALLPLAWILGYLYQRRQSLLAPILLHMLFNALTLTLVVLARLS